MWRFTPIHELRPSSGQDVSRKCSCSESAVDLDRVALIQAISGLLCQSPQDGMKINFTNDTALCWSDLLLRIIFIKI